jgi:hypothetical protein
MYVGSNGNEKKVFVPSVMITLQKIRNNTDKYFTGNLKRVSKFVSDNQQGVCLVSGSCQLEISFWL